MKLYAVLFGPAWEGTFLDSVWESKELATARQKELKVKYPSDSYEHILNECSLNTPRTDL